MVELVLRVAEDERELRRRGADLVAEVVTSRPDACLTAATGRTPLGIYEELGALIRTRVTDMSRVTAVQLDEYLGLGPGDHRSLLGWMVRSFVEPLGIPVDRVVPLPTEDPDRTCPAFDAQLADLGGFDLAILGLGRNGHLGFNEPPSAAGAGTRLARFAHRLLSQPAQDVGRSLKRVCASRHASLVVKRV